jgi:hypothetical protein
MHAKRTEDGEDGRAGKSQKEAKNIEMKKNRRAR